MAVSSTQKYRLRLRYRADITPAQRFVRDAQILNHRRHPRGGGGQFAIFVIMGNQHQDRLADGGRDIGPHSAITAAEIYRNARCTAPGAWRQNTGARDQSRGIIARIHLVWRICALRRAGKAP